MRITVTDDSDRIVYEADFPLLDDMVLSESEQEILTRGEIATPYKILILEGLFTHALLVFCRLSGIVLAWGTWPTPRPWGKGPLS